MTMPAWMTPLWDAINEYVTACGGDPSKHVYGSWARQKVVADVDAIVRKAIDEAVDRAAVEAAKAEREAIRAAVLDRIKRGIEEYSDADMQAGVRAGDYYLVAMRALFIDRDRKVRR